MSFGSNPLTGTQTALPANQFPLSSVAVPGTANGDLTALEGGPASTDSNGNKTAPASMYVKDGGNVNSGATTDSAITTDIAGTISAKLRGLVKISGDIWDSTNHRIRVDGSGVTQPISAVSLPLPTGAATSAKQPALGTAGSASTDVITVQGIASMTALKVDGSAVTQPISGTITANAGTGTFNNQQSNVQLDYDTSAGTQNLTMFGVALPASGGAVAGGTSSNPLRIDPTGTTTQPVSASQSGTWNITNISGTVSLPTGAATAAKQPALGTAGSASSDVLTVQGIASMTPLKVDGSGVTQPVSGTVTANQGGSSWSMNVAQIGGTNVVTGGASGLLAIGGPVASGASNADNPVKIGGAFNTTQPTVTTGQIVDAQYTARGAAIVATGVDAFAVNASQSGTWTIQPGNTANTTPWLATLSQGGNSATVTASNALKVDGSGVTQPVSGTVTANVGTTNGLALDTSVSGLLVSQGSTTSGEKGPLIQGAVTTAAPTYTTAQTSPISLTTAGAVRVDGSGVTQPISAASLPLPSGAATSAKQPALGTAGSASSDVITVQGIASMTALKVDGSAVTQPVSGTFWQATQPVSGTVTANAGTGTFNNQQTNITADYDTSAGTQNLTMFGIALPASGGAVSGGTSSNPVRIDPTGTTTQPISAASLPLPTGAATSAKQPALGTAGSASSDVITVQGIASMTALKVDGSGVTQPVSGTVTANIGTTNGLALDTSINGILVSQGSTTSGEKGPLIQGAVTTSAPTYTTAQTSPISLTTAGAIRVDGSGVTQPVSAASLPLPTGAATSAKQPALGTAGSASSDVITVQGIASMTALKVDGSAVTQPVSGTVTANAGTGTFNNQQSNVTADYDTSAGTQNLTMFGVALPASGGAVAGGTSSNPLRIDPTGTTTQPISAASLPLPTGAATSAKQPALGTAGSASSDVITVQGIASMTALKVDGSAVTQPVSGTVTANVGTTNGLALDTSVNGVLLSQGSTTSGQKGPLIQGAVTTSAPTYTTAQTSPISLTTAGAVRVDGSGVTQPVSGTFWQATQPISAASLPLPTGAATSAKQPALGTAGTASSDVLTVQGIASMTALKVDGSAVTQPVSGTITANQGGSNWSVNVAQVSGSTVATAATGVQKVGIVGNGGASVDSTVAAGSAPTNAVVIGAVYNSSAPAPTSGQAMAVQADQAGNMRMFPGVALAALSAWNSSTSLNATQNIFTNSGAAAVLVQLTQTSTLTAGAVTFEVSYDGSNWSTIPANCVLDPTSSTFAQISLPYTVQASTNKSFLLNMNGAQGLRAKLSTQISGTGTVTPNYALLPVSPADTVVALSPTAANFNTTSVIQAVAGTALTADQSNSILKTSLYVKKSANADTVLTLGSATSANSVPVVVASDQAAIPASQSGTWTAVPNAATSGGSTPSHTMSAASTNATSLKGSAGQIYGFSVSNANNAARYFKIYNKASAPTVGTDTPIMTVQVPGNGTVIRAFPVGLALGTGIAWAATTGIADSDTGAVGSNDLSIDIDYK